MKKNVCVNGQCQNTMKDYICVCNAGFRSDVTKKLCNGKVAKSHFCFLLFERLYPSFAGRLGRSIPLRVTFS